MRRWTEEEEDMVSRLIGTVSIPEAAEKLGRSEEALKSYLKRKNLGWGRWARTSPKRERMELIRQRHVVMKAVLFFESIKRYGAVVSKVDLVRACGAKAVVRNGVVVSCSDDKLLAEAIEKVGYVKDRAGLHAVYKRKP